MCTNKLFLSATVALSVFWASTALASEVIPTKGVSVLMVNGAEANSKMKPSNLKHGQNQIVVEMDKNIGKGSSNGQFTSAPFVITFEAGSDDIKINHPKVHSIQHAEQVFKNEPKWRLTSAGKSIDYKSDELKGKKGFLPYSDMDELVKEYNQQNGIYVGPAAITVAAASQVEPAVKSARATPKKQKTTQAAAHPQALEQMQAWYLKASKQDRKEFRKWMIDQE
ncbi:DUF2057 domain-containing protein [Vibrio tapetis subsp. quintayensis]|uniref:YccT family protein n=1 Tax=Vibrio tapetis TaxID=52443 RepID=UPI0025B55937|nr:DUF2057 domain-containing protein [Vibrio tapetis]MDN3682366.1 DUF2057 domain-containing protein [Vibrio tapetis subsp. quintayensis]